MKLFKKGLSFYTNLSIVKKAMLWFTLCSVIQRGISFLTVPLFTRIMSQEEYGTVAVFQSWEQVAFYIVTLGVTYGGFNTAMIKFEKDRNGYTAATTGLVILMGLIWLLFASFFSPYISQITALSPSLIIFLFCEVIFKAIYDIWICKTKFDFNYKKVIPASLCLAFLIPLLGTILVLTMQDKVLARIISFIAIEGLIAFIVLAGFFRKKAHFVNLQYWKFTLTFNIPLIPHYLSQVILSQSDRIMISLFCGSAEVSIYTIVYSVSMIIMIIVTAINSAFVPWMYRSIKNKTKSDIQINITYMLIFIGAGISLISLLGPEIMLILAPASYQEGVYILPPLSASVLFIFLYSICSNIEFYYEKKMFATTASLIASLSNIILNFILIPIFGYQAACFTTLLCYILLALFHFLFAQNVSKIKSSEKLLKGMPILGITSFFVILSLCLPLIYPFDMLRYLFVVVILCIVVLKRKDIVKKIQELR